MEGHRHQTGIGISIPLMLVPSGPPVVVTLEPFVLVPCQAPVSHYSFGPSDIQYQPSMFPNAPPGPYAGVLLPCGPPILLPEISYQPTPYLPLGIEGSHMLGAQLDAGVLPPFVPPSGNPGICNPVMPIPSLERGGSQRIPSTGGQSALTRDMRTRDVFRPQSDLNNNTRSCKYCRINGQPFEVFSSHHSNENGLVTCPLLRYFRCPYCWEDGHTKKYCPWAGSRGGHGQ